MTDASTELTYPVYQRRDTFTLLTFKEFCFGTLVGRASA